MRVRAAGLGGLLLSVLLVQALALPWPYNNVPSIDSLEGDMCNIYGEAALPFAANNFCNGTGFTTPGLLGYRCDVLALAEHTFQSFSKPNATCPAARQTRAANVSLNGEGSRCCCRVCQLAKHSLHMYTPHHHMSHSLLQL